MQVVLDTVELILGETEPDAAQPSPTTETCDEEPGGGGGSDAAPGAAGSSGWLGGTLQSLALRAGLNVSATVRNIVCKWVQDGAFVASATCQQVAVETSGGGWRGVLQASGRASRPATLPAAAHRALAPPSL